MKRTLLFAIIALAMIPDNKESFEQLSSPHFILHPLADGVWAAIHREQEGSHAICNAGIIDLGDKTVVIDPFMNLDAAEDLKKIAMQLTGKTPDYVINTHFHNDHIRGNQVFIPAKIVSTEWTKNQIALTEPEELKWEKENAKNILESYKKRKNTAQGLDQKELPLWINYFEGMVLSNSLIRTTLPDMTFNDSLWITGTKRKLKLKEFKKAHTESDVAVYISSDPVLFAGDMFFNRAHPWLSDGDPDSLKTNLKKFMNDDRVKIVIPGHGPVGEKKDLENMIQYISDLENMVRLNQQKGIADSSILKIPIPNAYRQWTFGSRFYAGNIQFLCKRK